MRILVLTAMMICLNQETFGTAKRSLEAYIDSIHIISLFENLDILIGKEARSLEIKKVIAEIKNENNLDCTLLNFAVMHKCTPNVVRFLHQKSGETINQQQASSGYTPLMYASLYNRPELLVVLLELDSSSEHVRYLSQEGLTALMLASIKGHTDIVGNLLATDSDLGHICMKSSEGLTALDYARNKSNLGVLALLEKVQEEANGKNKRKREELRGSSPILDLCNEVSKRLKQYSSE
jgi:uncharacterized protein